MMKRMLISLMLIALPVFAYAQTCYLESPMPGVLKQSETIQRNAHRKRVIALELNIAGIKQQEEAARESLEYLAGVNAGDRNWYTPRVQESLRVLEPMTAPLWRELARERSYVEKFNKECPTQASQWELGETELKEITSDISASLLYAASLLPPSGLLTEAEVKARDEAWANKQAEVRSAASSTERKLAVKEKIRLGLLAVLLGMAETSANTSCTYVNGKLVGCATISGNDVRITTPRK